MRGLVLGLTGLIAFVGFTRLVAPLVAGRAVDLSVPRGREILMGILFAVTLILFAMLIKAAFGA